MKFLSDQILSLLNVEKKKKKRKDVGIVVVAVQTVLSVTPVNFRLFTF